VAGVRGDRIHGRYDWRLDQIEKARQVVLNGSSHATQRGWDALRQASRDGLDGESFEIPDLTTSNVHPNGPPARVQRDSFHEQLVFGENRVAGVARFAVTWSTPDRSDAVMRQATVLEFATDEEMESFLVD
jgi:hypothetical protein